MLPGKIRAILDNEKIVMFICVLLFIAFGMWSSNIRSKQLYEHGYWTSGTVVGIGNGLKGSFAFKYQFYVKGKIYDDNTSAVGIKIESLNKFVG